MEQKIELKDAFSEFKKQKNIDRNIMISVLEDVFKTQLAKTYGSADNFDIIVNEKGDFEIFQNLEVVEKVENPGTQIALADVDDDFEIGDEYVRQVDVLKEIGRRGILNLKQNLQGRIMDIERANLYNKYLSKVGEIFTGEVYQTWSKQVLILAMIVFYEL